MPGDFVIHVEGADRIADKLLRFRQARILSEVADTVMPSLLTALKLAAPHKTGRLADSIRIMRSTSIERQAVDMTATVNVPYARYVLEGTRAHPIAAVNAQALRWYDQSGDAVFAKSVQHPATRANHFPQRVWRGLREPVLEEMVEQVRARLIE